MDNTGRSGRGFERGSQEAGTWLEDRSPVTVDTTVVGGAQEPRGSSPEYGILTQPIAKDGESVRESDTLRENGKGVELMGKQAGKLTEVDSPSSISPISQNKAAESVQWERVVECPEKVVVVGDLEAHSKRTEISEPIYAEAKLSGIHNCGPNTAVTSQA